MRFGSIDMVGPIDMGGEYTLPESAGTSGYYMKSAGSGQPASFAEVTSSGGAITGEIKMWPTTSAPSGYLLCDGAAVSQTTYAALYAIVGTTFGDPGGGNFNLPNFKGKVPAGYNSAETEFDTMGETGGAKTHTLTTAELATHNHTEMYRGNALYDNRTAGATNTTHLIPTTGYVTTGFDFTTVNTTADTGSGTAHNNLQPYITINYIIKT